MALANVGAMVYFIKGRRSSMRKTTVHHLLLGSFFFAVIAVTGYLLFVQTAWGQTFDFVAYFGHQDVHGAIVFLVNALFTIVKIPTLFVVAFLLMIIAAIRRRFFLGLMAVLGLAFAIGGAEYFKKELPRPELGVLADRVPHAFAGDTYPSGHTSFGMAIVLAFILVSPARWRSWMAVAAGVVSSVFATGVVFVGGHRPSDPVGAIFWSGVCLSVAAAVALGIRHQRFPVRPDPLALSASVFLAMAITVSAWLSTGWAVLDFSRNLPFLSMMGVIVFSAFAVTSWFAWVLSGEEERADAK